MSLSTKIKFTILLVPMFALLGLYATTQFNSSNSLKAQSGITYYVSSSGNNANDGKSIATAWQTVDKVSQSNFFPGDTILFEGGKTFSGKLYFDGPTDSSSALSPITIGSYGTGRATIYSTSDGIFVYNLGGITVNNINFLGNGSTNSGSGIYFYNELPTNNTLLSGITVRDVESSYFGQTGISLGSWGGTNGFIDVVFDRVLTHHNRDGISTFAPAPNIHQNVKVTNSLSYQNFGTANLTKPSGNGIVLGGVNGGLIERCQAYENGAYNTNSAGPVGIWTYDSNNITIQNNVSHHNSTDVNAGGGDGGGFDLDGGVTNSVMQYNYSYNNRGTGYLLGSYPNSLQTKNNTIRYNISENDGNFARAAGITVYGNTSSNKIYNNSIYTGTNSTNPAVYFLNYLANFSDLQISNNIFTTAAGAPIVYADNGINLAAISMKGNIYYSYAYPFKIEWNGTSYNSLASWKSTGQENGSGYQVNPLFVDPSAQQTTGYKLASTSPLINSGINLTTLGYNVGPYDYFGTTIPQANSFDIGAAETASIILPSPTPLIPTSTPIPVNSSPTPTTTANSGTIIAQGTGVNEDNSILISNPNQLWVGTGSGTNSYSAIRFPYINLPKGATITSAILDVSPTTNQWIGISFNMFMDASDNSPAFTATNRPSTRTKTTTSLLHNSNSNWLTSNYYALGNYATLVQSIVNRPGWTSGNAMSFIGQGISQPWGRKTIVNTGTFAPRLTITYSSGQIPQITPTSLPTPILPTATPKPLPTSPILPSPTPVIMPTATPTPVIILPTATPTPSVSLPTAFARYGFEETTGTTIINSANNQLNGTLMNNVTRSSTGKFGRGLTFRAASDYARLGVFNITNNNAFTIAMWIKTTSTSTNSNNIFNETSSDYTSYSGISLYSPSTKTIESYLYSSGVGSTIYYNTTNINDGQWHHIALVQSSKSSRSLYVDGVLVLTDTKTIGNLSNTKGAYLGGFDGRYDQFSGGLDEVRLYTVALSPTQIVKAMNTASTTQ